MSLLLSALRYPSLLSSIRKLSPLLSSSLRYSSLIYSNPIDIYRNNDDKEINIDDIRNATRNICIIAHIDHGKSSLSSQLLRYQSEKDTVENPGDELYDKDDSVEVEKEDISMLDTLAVEQERGITVKATTASMVYTPRPTPSTSPQTSYIINLFDSPGHVDFSHEVSRSLSHVDGALILFDSTQGIQAQTVAVYEKAKERGIKLIPVLTKVDMPSARPLEVAMSVSELFPEFDPDEIILTSARKNVGMREVLDAIAENVPPPGVRYKDDERIRAKVVDSWFEVQRGVVCLLKVESGELNEGEMWAGSEAWSGATISQQPSPHPNPSRSSLRSSNRGQGLRPRRRLHLPFLLLYLHLLSIPRSFLHPGSGRDAPNPPQNQDPSNQPDGVRNRGNEEPPSGEPRWYHRSQHRGQRFEGRGGKLVVLVGR